MKPLSFFLNEWLLVGVLGASVPFIIHLLHRSRYKVEKWGAMMFLQESLRARARTVKLQQLLLMILRSLIIAVLAIALARPILNPGKKEISIAESGDLDDQKQQPTTHVLIIDSSYSMQRGKYETSLFDQVRDTALQIVQRMANSDNMLIIRAGKRPRPLFRNPAGDRGLLERKIQRMKPGYEKADLLAAVKQAYLLLANSTRPKHRIYVLTDDQRVSWEMTNSAAWEELEQLRKQQKIQPTTYVYPHRVTNQEANLQIVKLYSNLPIVDVYRQNHFIVVIKNNGSPQKTRVEFYSGTHLEGEREVDLQYGLNSVGFDCSFSKPGPGYVRAVIPSDGLNVDNEYTLALRIVRQIPILLVEGHSNEDPFASDGGFIERALTAAAGEKEDTLISVSKRNQTEIDDLDSAYIAQFKTIILSNVSSLSSSFRLRLQRFVEQGGGLFIVLGSNVDADNYNTMFRDNKGLLPALLSSQSALHAPSIHPTFFAVSGMLLKNLGLNRTQILDNVNVNQFWYTIPAEDAQILAAFDEHPFLLHKPCGKGHVILWTTSTEGTWSNFPLTQDFLPLMQSIVVFLSSNIKPPINLKLAEPLLFAATLPNVQQKDQTIAQSATLRLPDKSLKGIPLRFDDGQWLGQYENTLTPGLYSTSIVGGPQNYYTVQLDESEGDLVEVNETNKSEVSALLNCTFVRNLNQLDRLFEQETSSTELWRHLIAVVLGLMLIEQFLGWRFN